MKYIENAQFKNIDNKSFKINFIDDNNTPKVIENSTIGDILLLLAKSYTQPLQDFKLGTDDIRKLNKVIKILEGEPQEKNYWRFEDADFNFLKNLVAFFSPLILVRNDPLFQDILNASKDNLPENTIEGENKN
ncbi:MAG: hypothetical protein AABY22_28405 [Nanoarchaeota archaeon]